MDSEFWQGKKVFLTGHTGFKGSWLSLWLQLMGAEVKGYALAPPTNPSIYEMANVHAGIQSEEADIRDAEKLFRSIKDFKPDIIFHLAAQSLVRYSYQSPVETYATNVMGTVHVLDAVRKIGGVNAVVIVTTDKCYENREWLWGYRENEPMGGFDPYSSSKGCAELAVASFRDAFFHNNEYSVHRTAIASVRAGNVIGGGDWATDRLIPDMVRAFGKGEPLCIRNPGAIRPWQHVLDPLSGYLTLGEKLFVDGADYAEAWNFGPKDDDVQTVEWIVERLVNLWGESAQWEIDSNEHPHEARFLKLDCSKAHARLGWWPKWTLQTSLEKIVDWHKLEISGANMRDVCLDQIKEYMRGQE